jgi:hypothetical protein
VLLAVVLVVTAGLVWLRQGVSETADSLARTLTGGRMPTVSGIAVSRPLPPPTSPGGSGGYTFLIERNGLPARYNPCRTIHVVMSTEAAPPGAEGYVRAGLGRLSAATGLQFAYDGLTDEPARDGRPAMDESRYGNRWSPVLVAWTTPARAPRLEGAVAGIGGSTAYAGPGGAPVYVSGEVQLDGPQADGILREPGGAAAVEAVVLHELAHVVGLGHVDDPRQLMAPTNTGQLDFGPGDLRGLAILGQGSCASPF